MWACLTVLSVVPLVRAVTINYHHTTGSRAPSLDDDEEEEDRLHAMISMICSRNLTDPNVMKGFYHLNTPPPPETSPSFRCPAPSPPPSISPALSACVCVLPDTVEGAGPRTGTWGGGGALTMNKGCDWLTAQV